MCAPVSHRLYITRRARVRVTLVCCNGRPHVCVNPKVHIQLLYVFLCGANVTIYVRGVVACTVVALLSGISILIMHCCAAHVVWLPYLRPTEPAWFDVLDTKPVSGVAHTCDR